MLRDWRIASLGAVVAVTAAALVLTQVVGTSAPNPRPRQPSRATSTCPARPPR